LILPDADELLWFEPKARPRLPKEGQILAKPIATAINGPVEDRIRIVHLDGGIEEIIEALVIGICENQVLPLLVDPPHDLHVLLRHPPRSISRAKRCSSGQASRRSNEISSERSSALPGVVVSSLIHAPRPSRVERASLVCADA